MVVLHGHRWKGIGSLCKLYVREGHWARVRVLRAPEHVPVVRGAMFKGWACAKNCEEHVGGL
jgi:hypothetical protein